MLKVVLLSFLIIIFDCRLFSSDKFAVNSAMLVNVQGANEDRFMRIPPPPHFLEKSTKAPASHFKIITNNLPNEAKPAFEMALKIWESLLHTDMDVNVFVNWRDMNQSTESGNLGAGGPTSYHKDLDGLTQNGVFYNVVVAEKLLRKNINNPNDPDIYIEFNSKANWYMGTDGQTPSGAYDFVTVALHELCHGLGYNGSMSVNAENKGIWGFGSQFPFSFDRFVYNGNNQQLIDLNHFSNPSVQLRSEFLSDNIFFSGPILNQRFGSKVALFAPSQFEFGSSIIHLHPSYVDGIDALMTPKIFTGASIHDPGPIALYMLQDIGWESLLIEHTPVQSREAIENIQIEAKIFADQTLQVIDPKIHYSLNNQAYVSMSLLKGLSDLNFSTTLNISELSEVNYYISAKDQYGREFLYPNTAPAKPLSFVVGSDIVKPSIAHVTNKNIFTSENGLILIAEAKDQFGIDTVYVEYFYNGVRKTDLGLRRASDNLFNVIVDLTVFNLQPADQLSYRIVAVDGSESANIAYYPETGLIDLEVIAIPEYIDTYETTFSFGINEFVLNGFDINIAKGFTDVALNSKHPYKIGGHNFTAELVYPVKIHEKYHYISFNEIVMVEAGEAGSVFGDANFRDFVIVEGSKDGGITWNRFADGWDSRRLKIWRDTYEQSRYFNNSEILYDLDLFRLQHIDLTQSGEFSIGDVVKIRFRLHSDLSVSAWGWAIDNLKIQTTGIDEVVSDTDPLGTALVKLEQTIIKVYPNPVRSNEIKVEGIVQSKVKWVRLYSSTGQIVYRQAGIGEDNKVFFPNGLSGLHILHVEADKKVYVSKIQIQN